MQELFQKCFVTLKNYLLYNRFTPCEHEFGNIEEERNDGMIDFVSVRSHTFLGKRNNSVS